MDFPEEVAAQIPQEYREHEFVKNAPDMPTFVKNAVETKKMVGDAIRFPAKDAKPEDSQKWWSETQPKLAERGFIETPPSKAEEYKLPSIEGFKADDSLVSSFVNDVALKTKMSQSQFEAVVAFQHTLNQEYAKNLMTPEAADTEFKNMLGGDYVSTMETVNQAMNALREDYPQFGEWSKTAYIVNIGPDGKPGKAYPFSSHPMVRGMFEVIGGMSTEDSSNGGQAPGGGATKEALRTQIDELMATPKFKAGDDDTVARVDELRKQLYGTAEV
jgi:hypothetical protein